MRVLATGRVAAQATEPAKAGRQAAQGAAASSAANEAQRAVALPAAVRGAGTGGAPGRDAGAEFPIDSGTAAVLESFLITVVKLAGARAGVVRSRTADGSGLRLVAAVGLGEELVESESLVGSCGVCGEALRGEGVCVAETRARCGRVESEDVLGGSVTGTVAVPLDYKGRPVGVFTLFFDGVSSLRAEVIHLLRPVGQLLGLTLENAKLEREKRLTSVIQERQAMAADLHDSLAQSITFVRMRMPLLQDAIAQSDGERARRYCGDISDELGTANRRLRDLISHFRAGMDAHGLDHALREAAASFFERSGIEMSFEHRGGPLALPVEAEVQVFHIVQEALANVRKHSGATRASLLIERDGPEATITVEDDGRGLGGAESASGEPGSHFGLDIMRERAASVGGRIAFEPRPGGGTRVRLSFPAGDPTSGASE